MNFSSDAFFYLPGLKIWMVLASHLPIGLLNLFGQGPTRDPQHAIVSGGHIVPFSPPVHGDLPEIADESLRILCKKALPTRASTGA